MPTFSKAPQSVADLALAIIEEYPSHAPLLKAGVIIDFVFAHADVDDSGEKINNAISSRGFRVLGQAKKMPLKDRAMGRGDAEITLDADHWNDIGIEERKALLDHEIFHLEVQEDERGHLVDDLERPKLNLRKHDIELGFFNTVASRHGKHSIERIQAQHMLDAFGQFYWPTLCGKVEEERPVTQTRRFTQVGRDMAESTK